MGNIKETFLKKYGVWEYVLMIIGLLICYKPVEYIVTIDFEAASWPVIGIVVFFLLLGVLFIAAPLSILELARKKMGLKTRSDKLDKKNEPA